MKKFKITMQAEIIVEFDENSDDFKNLFEGYTECIDSSADYEDLAKNIAYIVSKYGVDEFIEGIGFVKHNGKNQNIFHDGEYKERDGHINVEVDVDINRQVDFEVDYIEDLSDDVS